MSFLKRFSTMQLALGFSLGLHALLVFARFANPEGFNRVFQDTPLEVILVNARSSEAPPQAQAIAQANLTGGGEVERGRATSPLPPSPTMTLGDSDEDAQRKIEELRQEQRQLLAQTARQLAALPPPDPNREKQSSESFAEEEKRRKLVELMAEIKKSINEENSRPRKRFISPSTKEEVYAIYRDKLRLKVQDRGTKNFPQNQRGKLYGEVMLTFTIDANGNVLDVEVVRPSNSKALDRQAVAILKAASPFGTFGPELRQRADQLVVTYNFEFHRDGVMNAIPFAPSNP